LNHLVTHDPDTLHVALFGSAMAVYRILESERVVPDVLAGHSLGEIAALVAGGAFTVGDWQTAPTSLDAGCGARCTHRFSDGSITTMTRWPSFWPATSYSRCDSAPHCDTCTTRE
jgi:hypothetical protein